MSTVEHVRRSGAKRWMREEEVEQIVKGAALALTLTGEALPTSELLDALERGNFGPPGSTRSGRLRQLEKALESDAARVAGIALEPGKFPKQKGKGRPATRRWRLVQQPSAAAAAG